jgi:hypothetical protein
MEDQDVPSIMRAVTYYHKRNARQYDKIAGNFDRGSEREIAKSLFDFCKRNIEYCVETEESQSIRTPGRILEVGYGDCKHYASFIAGVLDALKRQGLDIDWAYRFAKYQDIAGNITNHVFVILYDQDGREIWIDPVLNWFDYHLKYKSATTKSVDTSNAVGCAGNCTCGYTISGCGCNTMGSTESDFQDALKQFELGLYSSYSNLLKNGTVNSSISTIVQAAAASFVPGAAQALAVVNQIKGLSDQAFGAGSDVSRAIAALTSGNIFTAIPGVFNAIFGARTFNSQSYYLYQDYSYHVLGVDAGSTDHVTDAQVPVSAAWFTLKTGIFIPGRNFLGALRDGVDNYLNMISQNPRTTQDRVRVQLGREVVINYMPNVLVPKNWAGTVGVYDNAVTAAIEKLRIADPNARTDTSGTDTTGLNTGTALSSLLPSGVSSNLLPIALVVGGLYFLTRN